MRKSVAVAYALWALLGSFGAHRFYLGRHGTGSAMLALASAGTLLGSFGGGWPMQVGIVAIIACSAWTLADLQLLRAWRRSANVSRATPRLDGHSRSLSRGGRRDITTRGNESGLPKRT